MNKLLNKWEKFELQELLGQGAYGEVYKALDKKLNRIVALKVLTIPPDGNIEKFRREATNQAKVDHPNICKVYEVGTYKDFNFISMQFIQGQTLDKAVVDMTLKDKVKIIRKVCQGLHAAHLTGLIHRDIKPSNILVKKGSDGKFVPFITDFGISRQLNTPKLSKEHASAGSPHYMSPEQAAGDASKALDIRTDIYSLGVTLYELLTGKTPHSGEITFEILYKIIHNEPKPIENYMPKISHDLAAIVNKCLKKNPSDRYESARELAEDCKRFLEDRPVFARPSGTPYKLYKKIKRHPVFSTFITLSSVLIFMLCFFWINEKIQTSSKIAIAQELGQIINQSEHSMRVAFMMPLHDIRPEINNVRREINLIQNKLNEIGPEGKGPGYYALGKCYLILKDRHKAKSYFERALKAGYWNSDLYYQLGIINGFLYIEKRDKLSHALNEKTFNEEKQKLKVYYLEKAVYYLQESKSSENVTTYYGKALISYMTDNNENSLMLCRQALNAGSWFYETYLLMGQIHLSRAEKFEIDGDYKNAETEYSLAEDSITKAIQIAESDPACHKLLSSLWIKRFSLIRKDQEKMKIYREKANYSLQKAITINPDNSDTNTRVSVFYWHWAEYQLELGKDCLELVENAINAAKKALKEDPNNHEAWHHLGNSYLFEGLDLMSKGESPERSFGMAEDYFRKSLEFSPSFILNHINLGVVLAYWGSYEYGHGKNPIDILNRAIDSFKTAEKIDPNNIFIYSNIGGVYYLQGDYLSDTGKNPVDHYEKAINYFGKGLKLSPEDNSLYINISGTYISMASYNMNNSLNPEHYIEMGIKASEKCVDLMKDSSYGYINLSSAYLIQGEYKQSKSLSPEEDFQKAMELGETAVSLSPNLVDALDLLAHTKATAADWYKHTDKKRATTLLNEAEILSKEALQIDSSYTTLHTLLAVIYLNQTELTEQSKEQKTLIQKSLQSANNALRLSPEYSIVYKIKADVLYKQSIIENNKDILNTALENIEKAIQIDPKGKDFNATKQSILSLVIEKSR